MFHSSRIDISRSALEVNLQFIRNRIGPNVRLCSVVKGNAYGHGIHTYVPLAESMGVDYFGVFSSDEAVEVLNCCSRGSSVLIMGFVEDEALEWMLEQGVEFFVFDFHRLRKAIEASVATGYRARIHLEVETGMNRTGWDPSEKAELLQLLADNKQHLDLRGLCTHLAGAENMSNYPRIREQLKHFQSWKEVFNNADVHFQDYHAACSAAVLRFPESHFSMVRLGILQYGLWPSRESHIEHLLQNGETDLDAQPQRLLSWKSKIMHIKTVPEGSYIGYGSSYLTARNTRVGVVPIGYSHGYSRGLSNLGRVLVRQRRVSVLGVVNMNALVINLEDCPAAEHGDEVVLIGWQQDKEISVASFSDLSDQLNYESLTRLDPSIPRIITD